MDWWIYSNDSLGSGKIEPFVTTGAVDAASVSARGGGFEYTNRAGEKTIERSSLFDSPYLSTIMQFLIRILLWIILIQIQFI